MSGGTVIEQEIPLTLSPSKGERPFIGALIHGGGAPTYVQTS